MLIFSHLGLWSRNFFLIAPFPDRCLLVPASSLSLCLFTRFKLIIISNEVKQSFLWANIDKFAIVTDVSFSSIFQQNVNKYYGLGYVHAVKDVSLGIAKEECFGLLGQNGAGKTTTFKMLTGDEIISSGSAYLDKYSVKKDIKKVILNDAVLEYSIILWLQIQMTEDIGCICNHMSRIVRKPDFCLGENKGADQLRGNREADQRLCFRYSDSTIPLLLKSEISSF